LASRRPDSIADFRCQARDANDAHEGLKHDVTKEKWDRDESDLQRCHQGEKEGETCKGAKHEDKPAGRNSCAALQYHNGHGLTLDLPAGAPEVVGAMEGTITL
jgi:hypothetical protein